MDGPSIFGLQLRDDRRTSPPSVAHLRQLFIGQVKLAPAMNCYLTYRR